MTNKLKLTHWVLIVLTATTVIAPPAKANLIAVIQLVYSWIETTLGGFNSIIKQENANGQATANSHKLSTDTLGGIIAEQTKTLGGLEYKLNFGSIGRQGRFKIDSIAPSGCFAKKKAVSHDKWIETKEQATEETLPMLNAYAGLKEELDYHSDRSERRGIFKRAKELGLLDMGLYPNRNLNHEEYEIWVEMIKYFTVPDPLAQSSSLSSANKLKLIQNSERYKHLVGIVQESMLRYAVDNKDMGDESSRSDILKAYKAYANSFTRTKSANLKTNTGLQRELAEADAMLLDIQANINETNDSIAGLLTILAIESTDNFADRINK